MKPASLTLLLLAIVVASPKSDGALYVWEGSSGLFPDQVPTPMTLVDAASPESPQLSAGTLTLITSDVTEQMYYIHSAISLAVPSLLQIESRLRFVSGADLSVPRTPAHIVFSFAPDRGNALFIGVDEIFLLSGNLSTRGPSVAVDTNDAFHTYRLDVNTNTGAIDVFYDLNPVPVISGAAFIDAGFTDAAEIYFGDGSDVESGVSEWQTFIHNAAVPEPSAFAYLIAAATALLCAHSFSRR
jgi:hypothetical protein